jgi:hypothetical protein
MEGELISALEEIDRLIIKNRKQKQLLIQFGKDSKQPDEDFACYTSKFVNWISVTYSSPLS